jgi:hypothetical protein
MQAIRIPTQDEGRGKENMHVVDMKSNADCYIGIGRLRKISPYKSSPIVDG